MNIGDLVKAEPGEQTVGYFMLKSAKPTHIRSF
jgi:hypothetical protein